MSLQRVVDALQEFLSRQPRDQKLTDDATFVHALTHVCASVGVPSLPESVEQLSILLQTIHQQGDTFGNLQGAVHAMLDVLQYQRTWKATPSATLSEEQSKRIRDALGGN